jgi:hypothetical protein
LDFCASAESSHAHSVPTIFTIVLAINDKHTLSVNFLLNICQESPHLALMATKAPTCIQIFSPALFSPFDINVKEEPFFP